MADEKLLIIGGGVAGLSAGCYALQCGYRTTIVEHNLALGGVCTAWPREGYLIDGCIHWLTGGPFLRVYEELGIVPEVPLRTLEHWLTYRDARSGIEVPFTRDLDRLVSALSAVAPEDAAELHRMREAVERLSAMKPPMEPQELMTMRDGLRAMWDMRHDFGSIVHFRKPMKVWAAEHLKSDGLRRMFTRLIPDDAPAFFLLSVLGYLERGWLSRPEGGTARFRDALVASYRRRGGEVMLHATVDEILVEGDRARGVRLSDGTMIEADVVVSTSSGPETVLRLLGGRYGAGAMRERLEKWRLFDPIVLASFGVAKPYAEAPPTLIIDHVPRYDIGGREGEQLYLRVYNDDPAFAPPGHTVVQAMVPTDYAWWATRGLRYGVEKDLVAKRLLELLAPHFPGIEAAVRMTDIATPLTYWGMARSWRGAYEGWMPDEGGLMVHVKKTLPGLSGLYMAGQWVEPGGGVPPAALSGRQVIELVCHDGKRAFVPGDAAAR